MIELRKKAHFWLRESDLSWLGVALNWKNQEKYSATQFVTKTFALVGHGEETLAKVWRTSDAESVT